MEKVTRTKLSILSLCLGVAASFPASAQHVHVIRVAAHYNAAQSAPLTACFRRYQAIHPDIRIEYRQISYRDYLQTTLISRAGNTSVDIYNLYSIWGPQLIGTGALDIPPPDIDRFVRAAYNPATIGAATIHGRLWGIPTAVSVYQLVYNRKLLAAAGFQAPPRTWPELETVAAAVTRKNRQGNIVAGGYAYGPSTANVAHVFYAQMFAAGMPPYTRDLRGTNLRSRAAEVILTRQVRLFRRGITSNSISVREFNGGTVGMAVLANWQKDSLRAAFGPAFDQTVGVAPIPTEGGGGTMIYSFFWGVDSASRQKRRAWNLLRWLNEARRSDGLTCTGAMLAGMGDLTGNRRDLVAMQTNLADPFSRGFVAELGAPGATSQPNLWHAEEVDRLLKYYIESAWAGRMSAAAALAAADTGIRAILAEQP